MEQGFRRNAADVQANPAEARVLFYECYFFTLVRRVKCCGVSAWSRADTLTFHLSERFQGNGSLLAHDEWYNGHFKVDAHDEVTVQAVPLDPLLLSQHPRLVKIDVEGAEPDVLAGMTEWLAEARDTAIAVEVVRHRMGERRPAFADQLTRLVAAGWQLAVVKPDGSAAPIDLPVVLEVGWFDNILLLR